MSSRVRTGADPAAVWPILLRSGDGRARARPWWNDPTVAQLTFIDNGVVPSSTALRVWLSELRARGFASVRTGAVTEAGADILGRQGFEILQRLHLLDLSLIGWRPPEVHDIHCRRLRVRERAAAAEVDRAAFTDRWAIDERAIAETCDATPAHRARTVDGQPFGHDGLAGYAITGRADHTGYLQRLAVDPHCQRRGVGLGLTTDSLIWMQRRHLTRAVVNTHTDNDGAVALYQRVGFRILPHGLAVLVRHLDDV